MRVHAEGRLEGWHLGESPLHLGFLQPHWLWILTVLRRKNGSTASFSLCLVHFPPSPSAPSSVIAMQAAALSALAVRGLEGRIVCVSEDSRRGTGLRVWG